MSKIVLVTGGSRGIGAATCIRFAEAGHTVILNYNRSREAALMLAHSQNQMGRAIYPCHADISDRASVEKMVDSVIAKFGRIDVLVNNAGIAKQQLFTDVTAEDWNRMISVNLTGTFNCTQSVLSHMIRRHSGVIINVSSVWGQTGASCEVVYSATKAAIIGMTKALAKEVGPTGIRVNCVAPGVINTEMNAALSLEDMNSLIDETPLCRIGETDDVAALIAFLASDDASFITGQVIAPNGGFYI